MPTLRSTTNHPSRIARGERVPAEEPRSTPAAPSTSGAVVEKTRPKRAVTGDDAATTPSGGAAPPGTKRPLTVRLDHGRTRRSMEKDEIRAHVVTGGKLKQVPFEQGFASKPAVAPGAYQAVSAADVERAFASALEQRKAALADPSSSAALSPVTPEDGSVRVVAYHMGFGAMDSAGERFIEQLADIGRVEGFRVVVRVHAGDVEYLKKQLGREERNNVTVVPSDAYHDIWSEDAGEVRRDRSVAVPPLMPSGANASLEVLKARYERLARKEAPDTDDVKELYEAMRRDAPAGMYGVLGQVWEREQAKSYAALAVSSGKPLVATLSYLEGGNVLIGSDARGAPCAFVGRDSFDLTRNMLGRELGKRLDDEEVRAIIGRDLGLPASAVHAVEQPDYHLDVKMVPIAPGEVLLNDSVAAAKAQEEWARGDHEKKRPAPPRRATPEALAEHKRELEWWKEQGDDLEQKLEHLHKVAKSSAAGEASAQRDLEKAGMKVHRVAAVFPWVSMAPMNFLNAEQGRGADGQRFYIALGGDPRGERLFLDQLQAKVPGAVARCYFLDRKLTHQTLVAGGGVNCRAKPEAAQG